MSLHQIGAALYIPAVEEIDDALETDPDVDLIGMFTSEDTVVEIVRIRKTSYLLDPYVGMLLERKHMLAEAWSRLRGAIVKARAKVYFQPIIEWLRVTLTQKRGN